MHLQMRSPPAASPLLLLLLLFCMQYPHRIDALASWFSSPFGSPKSKAKNTNNHLLPQAVPEPEFRRWCDSVGLRAPSLIHSDATKDGVPGIVVSPTASLKPGEVAITLPVDAAIVVLADDASSIRGKSPMPNVLSDASWSGAPQKLRLACKLLEERRLGAESHYEGYVAHLPPLSGEGRHKIDTLGDWTKDELALLRSPGLVDKTMKRAASDDEWYQALEGRGSGDDDDDRRVFTREEFDWALSVVRTRAFAGDFSVPRNGIEGDYALLPFIDDLNHRETTSKSSDASAPASTNNLPPFKFPPVSAVLGRTRSDICWVAHVAHMPGDEVAHSYLHGAEGIAEDFLHEWGFAPGGADIDASTLNVKGVRVVVRGDGRVEDEGRIVDLIRRKLQSSQDKTDNAEGATDADVWRCIAATCNAEALHFKDDEDATTFATIHEVTNQEDDDVSAHRRAIAGAFLDGKKRLLRAASEWALIRTDERARIRARSIQ